ncbi:hypothetical protein [Roseobacter sinensis]|uniref:hypothetical protein n=1 Tax=Roseobacter sinensis TaxID=2931391 RepID=UPI0021E7C794|nr:hypothetical protein [Roseobacter sp. WL0113]
MDDGLSRSAVIGISGGTCKNAQSKSLSSPEKSRPDKVISVVPNVEKTPPYSPSGSMKSSNSLPADPVSKSKTVLPPPRRSGPSSTNIMVSNNTLLSLIATILIVSPVSVAAVVGPAIPIITAKATH